MSFDPAFVVLVLVVEFLVLVLVLFLPVVVLFGFVVFVAFVLVLVVFFEPVEVPLVEFVLVEFVVCVVLLVFVVLVWVLLELVAGLVVFVGLSGMITTAFGSRGPVVEKYSVLLPMLITRMYRSLISVVFLVTLNRKFFLILFRSENVPLFAPRGYFD